MANTTRAVGKQTSVMGRVNKCGPTRRDTKVSGSTADSTAEVRIVGLLAGLTKAIGTVICVMVGESRLSPTIPSLKVSGTKISRSDDHTELII